VRSIAIVNTTLLTIGRPDELRDRLFARTITVRTLNPLADPARCSPVSRGGRLARGRDDRQLRPRGLRPSVAAPAATRALVGAGADVLSIAESHHSLEDVYLELIDEDSEASRREA